MVRPDKIRTSDEELLAISLTDQTVLLPVGAIYYGFTFTIAVQLRETWRAGVMTSWWKHADKCNSDFQLTSRYGNLWLCSVQLSFCHKQNNSSDHCQFWNFTPAILQFLTHGIRTSVFTNDTGQVQTEEQNETSHTQQHTPHKIMTEKTRYMLQRLHSKDFLDLDPWSQARRCSSALTVPCTLWEEHQGPERRMQMKTVKDR